MEERIKLLNCALCEKKTTMLINVNIAGLSSHYNNGICKSCFEKNDLELKVLHKNRKVIEAQIKDAKDSLTFWEDEMKEIELVKP